MINGSGLRFASATAMSRRKTLASYPSRPRRVSRTQWLAGIRLIALALSVALLATLPGPTVAQAAEAPASACQLDDDPNTAFDTKP